MRKAAMRCAGCIDAFTKKAGLFGTLGQGLSSIGKKITGEEGKIGGLEALFGGLGLYYSAKDIYEGIQNRSVGQTLLGAAGIPMSLAGGGVFLRGDKDKKQIKRIRWHDRLKNTMPRLAKIPGTGLLGRAADFTERTIEGLGGHITHGIGKGLTSVGAPGAGEWVSSFGPMGKQFLGFMAAQHAMNYLNPASAAEPAGRYGSSMGYAQPPAMFQDIQNVAPSF